jgi:hypothetical protein
MFGRRKTPDREEPLVPHGLIGQATDPPDEPGQAPEPANAAASVEVIEMSVRREKSPSASGPPQPIAYPPASGFAQTDSTAPKLGAISPPIPWPSPKTASVIRRVPPPPMPSLTTSAVTASPTGPEKPQLQTVPQGGRVIHAENKSAIVEVSIPDPSVDKPSRRPQKRVQIFRALRRTAGNACASSARTLGVVYGKAQTTYAGANLPARLGFGRRLLKHSILVAMAGCRAAGTRLRSVWKSTAPGIARFKSASKASSEAVRSSIPQFVKSLERVRHHRVHLRIKRSAPIQALIEHSKQAWNKREESIRRDDRLLTSVAMAALSALLALAVLSEVSHNAPGAHASNKSIANSSQHNSTAIKPRIVAEPRTDSESARKTTGVSRSSRSSQAAQANSSRAQKNSLPESAMRRPRHHEPDDYVAPDTYHYYGQQGKSR